MIEKTIGLFLLFIFFTSFLSVVGNILAMLMNPKGAKVKALNRFIASLVILVCTFTVSYKMGYFIDKYEGKIEKRLSK
ncbi:hypothetical protein [Pseudoalteromonas umbrosa]|uniref:hypothetical protein n=1 Tax=Pseudoalteromonas umbrosa TaxID=3048489 RepID=UPI0024C3DE4D|nr:hypothetical protein [Pseudoalteromonas sp. B95]MDK1287934.1 hypothetical protein [Pseudoalteromonas sp. B95]